MTLSRAIAALDLFGRVVGGLSCAALFLLLIAEITLRKAGVAFLWSAEYSTFLMAFIVFFPLAGVTRRREHLAADFFIAAMGGRVEAALRRWVIPVATLLFCAAIFALAAEQTWMSWRDDMRSTGPLRTPIWLPQLGMVAALAATLVSAAADLFAPAQGGRAPEEGGAR